MKTRLSPTAEKVFPSGAWRVSDIVHGCLTERVYFGYSKREAIALFRAELEEDSK